MMQENTDLLVRMSSKLSAEETPEHEGVEQAQLRTGLHTTLPVSKRFRALTEGFTGILQTSHVASGGSFSRLPSELIPRIAAHLTASEDLLNFSLGNKSIHVMLLHALFKAEVRLAKSYLDDLAEVMKQSRALPAILARALIQQYPHTRQQMQHILPAILRLLEPCDQAVQNGFDFLQAMIQEHIKPWRKLMESTNPARHELSNDEKHVLILHMLCDARNKPETIPFIDRVKTMTSQIKDILEQKREQLEGHFKTIHGDYAAQAQLPAQAQAQAPGQLLAQAQAQAQVQAQLPAQAPAQVLAQLPAQMPAQVQAQVPGQLPAQLLAQPQLEVQAQLLAQV